MAADFREQTFLLLTGVCTPWEFMSGTLFKGMHAELNQMRGWWQTLLSQDFFTHSL